jgi:hypothetical protein
LECGDFVHQISKRIIEPETKKLILEHYVHECRASKNLPYLRELEEAAFREMWMEKKMQLIQESVLRHDDQLFGFFSREAFIAAAMKHEFNDESIEPHVDMKRLCYDVEYILASYHLTFLNRELHECHTPIVGVW